jgi:hypothetical protein
MTWSRVLHELSRDKAGPFHRDEAERRGIPFAAIEHEVSVGRFVRWHAEVYAPVAVRRTLDTQLRAALLAAGPDAVVSHRAAAHRHCVSPVDASAVVEILVPHHCRPRLAGVHVHRSLALPSHHVTVVDGLRVTTVDRTLADLGAVSRSWVVAAAMEAAVIAGKTDISRLYRFVDDHGRSGRAGIGALRAALDDWLLGDQRPGSALEVMFVRLVDRLGIPMPQLQYKIADGSRVIARVDAAWPEIRLAVEVDGAHAHATAQSLQRDLARQNALVLLGWTVLRFTWNDVVRRPAAIASALRPYFPIPGT